MGIATLGALEAEVENLKASETACQVRLNGTLEKIDRRLGGIDDKLDIKIGDLYSKIDEVRNEANTKIENAVANRPASSTFIWVFSTLTFFLGVSVTIIGMMARGG